MRVAFLTANARFGDAIGNQIAEKVAFFLDTGSHVCVFVESDECLHPFLQPHCHKAATLEPDSNAWAFLTAADLIIVEYGHFYGLLHWLPLLINGKARILFDYHG